MLNNDILPTVQKETHGAMAVTFFLTVDGKNSASPKNSDKVGKFSTITVVTKGKNKALGYDISLVDTVSPVADSRQGVSVAHYISTEKGAEIQSSVAYSDLPRAAFDDDALCARGLGISAAMTDIVGRFEKSPGDFVDNKISGLSASAVAEIFEGFGENTCALRESNAPVPDGEVAITTSVESHMVIPGNMAYSNVKVANVGPVPLIGLTLSVPKPDSLTEMSWQCDTVYTTAECSDGYNATRGAIEGLALPVIPVGTVMQFNTWGPVTDPSALASLTIGATVTLPDGVNCSTSGSSCTSTSSKVMSPQLRLKTNVSGITGGRITLQIRDEYRALSSDSVGMKDAAKAYVSLTGVGDTSYFISETVTLLVGDTTSFTVTANCVDISNASKSITVSKPEFSNGDWRAEVTLPITTAGENVPVIQCSFTNKATGITGKVKSPGKNK